MKTSILALAFAPLFVAGQLPNLPECGKCITQVLAKYNELGCDSASNFACLCNKQPPNYLYGVRDCATQSCPASDVQAVIAAGDQLCANASSAVSGGTSATSSGTLVAVSTGADSAGHPVTTTLVGDAASNATSSGAVMNATSPVAVSTISSGSSAISTVFSTPTAGGAGVVTTITTNGTTMTSTMLTGNSTVVVGSTTTSGTATTGTSSSAAGGSSSSSRGVAPHATGAPQAMLGLIGAIGALALV